MTQLHTCPACRREFSGVHELCPTCTSKKRVVLSQTEIRACRELEERYGPFLTDWDAAVLSHLVRRLEAGEQPTLEDRLFLLPLVYAFAVVAEQRGDVDWDAETLYRKLSAHDRVTMEPAPFPPLPGQV